MTYEEAKLRDLLQGILNCESIAIDIESLSRQDAIFLIDALARLNAAVRLAAKKAT